MPCRLSGSILLSTVLLAAAAAIITPAAAAASSPCACTADLDGDVEVGFNDLIALLAQRGPCPGCGGDLDHDDAVGFGDLLILLSGWGPCAFEYGPVRENQEAEQIGLEMLGAGGPLLLADERYERIVRDLALIRLDEPGLADQIHTPAWAPGQLNVVALAAIYQDVEHVQFAQPNALVGGQNFYSPSILLGGTWRWSIDDGFHDCFDGCDCHRLYVIDVGVDGDVTLISYTEVGLPWCEFKRP